MDKKLIAIFVLLIVLFFFLYAPNKTQQCFKSNFPLPSVVKHSHNLDYFSLHIGQNRYQVKRTDK